jgi:hypothetical protein
MDNKCQAIFDPKILSYRCCHCLDDCFVNQATKLGQSKGYDIYILPRGSCVADLLKKNQYEAIVGVACSQELKLGNEVMKNAGLIGQAVPLIKNGCATQTLT